MASVLRLHRLYAHSARFPGTRRLSSTPVARDDVPAASSLGTLPAQKRPIGGFRGGIIGFLFGFSLAASYAAYNLLEEYKQASAALQASVDELRLSTERVSEHIRRIDAVERDMKQLARDSATQEDLGRVRSEMKKLYDGLHIELLDLKTHIWGIQQDLHALAKKEGTSVRIQ